MAACAIKCCGKNSRKSSSKTDGITFHRFPSDSSYKEKWIAAAKRDGWLPTKYSVVCSCHFSEDCFLYIKNRRRLLGSAVPTLYLPGCAKSIKTEEADHSAPSQEVSLGTPNLSNEDDEDSILQSETTTKNRLRRRVLELKKKLSFKNKQLKNVRERTRYLEKRVETLNSIIQHMTKHEVKSP